MNMFHKANLMVIFLANGMCMTSAFSTKERCKEDLIANPTEGRGRNAWARKCGYYDNEDEEYNNKKGYYVIFSNFNSPRDENAACISGLTIQGTCPVGCFSPNELVLFNNEEIAISRAARQQEPYISSLSTDSHADNLSLEFQKVEAFTVGQTKKELYKISAENGKTLLVTHDHPMVFLSGDLGPARSVKPGDQLLTLEGPTKVTAVDMISYQGEVWNIQPISEDKLANIHVANGFLTGSIRFQNQWAEESFRIWRRAKLSVEGI